MGKNFDGVGEKGQWARLKRSKSLVQPHNAGRTEEGAVAGITCNTCIWSKRKYLKSYPTKLTNKKLKWM